MRRACLALAALASCGGGGSSLYLGTWHDGAVLLSVQCAYPTGSFQAQLGGDLSVAKGNGVDLSTTDTGGCVFQWDIQDGAAVLQGTPVCTVTFADPNSASQIAVTATWAGTLETTDGSTLSLHLDGTVTSITSAGAPLACPAGSAAIDGTLSKI
ncbi:MAG: hypothetical protein ACYDCL_02360 [Myxococcales bacterium]